LRSSGPSKWTNEQLMAAFTAPNSKFPEVLLEFVNLATQGQLPASQFLLASTLMALEKPNGGVRPIAVGEVLARVMGKCAMVMVAPSAFAACVPPQFDVCTDAANESVVSACRGFMQAEPEGVVFLRASRMPSTPPTVAQRSWHWQRSLRCGGCCPLPSGPMRAQPRCS
jgi:hypothetical protein